MADLRLLRARNRLADGFKDDAAEIAADLVNGDIDLTEWAKAFASLISHGITTGFQLGLGVDVLDQRSSAIVTGLIQTQYSYAGPFAQAVSDAIDAGTPMSQEAIASRSGLYAGGVIQSHEFGQADRYDISLPAYPGDGSTPCMGNCRCYWSIEANGTVIVPTWVAIDDAHTCDECARRGEQWAPYDLSSMAA